MKKITITVKTEDGEIIQEQDYCLLSGQDLKRCDIIAVDDPKANN